jgi:hypothetical protein
MADDKDNGADDMLDSLFAEARSVEPRAELVARVLADADRVLATSSEAPAPEPRGGFFSSPPSWIAALGGWGGFGGVTAAGLVGLALGFWSPDVVDVISGGQIGALTGGGSSLDLVELALETGDV